MKSFPTQREQPASFSILTLMLTIAPLWLMLAAANMSAQTSNAVPSSTTTTSIPAETMLGVDNVGNLQLKWKNPIAEYGFGTSLSSPVVANGILYVSSRAADFYALDASTGATLWSVGGAIESNGEPPAVANGVVYFGALSDNNPATLYALNATTGTRLWSFAPGSQGFTAPVVVNGEVYIVSSDGNVYALNAGTGAKLWSVTTGSNVYSSLAVANGVVYIGSFDGNVYALNATTGAKLWSFTVGGQISSPAVANGVVYVGSNENVVYALNASTGAKLWSVGGAGFESSPVVANGVVYIGCGENLCALNATTGATLWTSTIETNSSAAVVANGVVYAISSNSEYALNAGTGAVLWSYSVPPGMNTFTNLSGSTVVDGVLYVSAATDLNTQVPDSGTEDIVYAFSTGADLFLRVQPSSTTVHSGDLLTYAFPVWNLGPTNAVHEVLNTQVPAGTTFDYVRISGTPGLGTCTTPPYQGTGQIVCHENAAMAPDTTWTVRLTVKVTAPSGTVITENAATMSDTPDPNMANNTATVSLAVQ